MTEVHYLGKQFVVELIFLFIGVKLLYLLLHKGNNFFEFVCNTFLSVTIARRKLAAQLENSICIIHAVNCIDNFFFTLSVCLSFPREVMCDCLFSFFFTFRFSRFEVHLLLFSSDFSISKTL